MDSVRPITPLSAPEDRSALIAMSGGVDSSVAAWLTLGEGFRAEGATMRLFHSEDIGRNPYKTCCSQRDIEDAAEVAFQLDIPFEVLDFTAEFREMVMEKFVRVYEEGGTPNPCLDCNRCLKFHRLFRTAAEKGLRYVVTGHYARVERDPASGRLLLKKALDAGKDQSYVLYMLSQEQLARVRFPLGTLQKEETRALALRLGFPNARKRDSQDICFVPDGDYAAFLEKYRGAPLPPGDFLDEAGRVVGRHRGAAAYTLGQRKGLGLALGAPVYVFRKDMARNTVSVGPERLLFSDALEADELNWISIPALEGPMRVKAMTHYRQSEQDAALLPLGPDRVRVRFDAPQRGLTPGQAVVFYQGDTVVGGGTIRSVGDMESPSGFWEEQVK